MCGLTSEQCREAGAFTLYSPPGAINRATGCCYCAAGCQAAVLDDHCDATGTFFPATTASAEGLEKDSHGCRISATANEPATEWCEPWGRCVPPPPADYPADQADDWCPRPKTPAMPAMPAMPTMPTMPTMPAMRITGSTSGSSIPLAGYESEGY